ncbi:MAG: DUF481 domain-containing protein [Luteimonas sp.]|nr:DUF481 domain-containing protein [Luteimonas sp.]
MLASWWLAVAGLPVFLQPLPEAPDRPAAVAIASGQVSLRQPCYSLVCPDAEWLSASRSPAKPGRAPGAYDRIAPTANPQLQSRRIIGLRSPATRRDWFYNTGRNDRIATTYGFEAIRNPDTRMQVELGTGYRIQPYVDYGTASQGPIARGSLLFSQRFGERAFLLQRVHVETGRANTFVRQTIGFDLQLIPQWSLRSDFELRHNTAGNGGNGATDTEGSLSLRYTF